MSVLLFIRSVSLYKELKRCFNKELFLMLYKIYYEFSFGMKSIHY